MARVGRYFAEQGHHCGLAENADTRVSRAVSAGESLYGLQNTNQGRMVIFGGYPLERDGDVVGAIGISGGAVEQDRDIAAAGVRAFEAHSQ